MNKKKIYCRVANSALRKGKKLVVVLCFCFLLSSLAGCRFQSRGEYLAKSNRSDEKQAEETMQGIIDALNEKDAKAIKAMFSEYARDNAEDLDEEIQHLIEFYPGCSGKFTGDLYTQEITNRGVEEFVINGAYKVPNGEHSFDINFVKEVRNDKEKEKEGLHIIEVLGENAEPAGFKWKEKEDRPGIYIWK